MIWIAMVRIIIVEFLSEAARMWAKKWLEAKHHYKTHRRKS